MTEPEIQPPSKTEGGQGGYGLIIGLSVGLALGIALDNLAIGLAIGVAIGMAFVGAASKRPEDPSK